MTNTWARAYTEVLEILKYLPADEYNKIPSEEIEFYENHKDYNYVCNYNPKNTIKSQNISREAIAILVTIFRDFFATYQQKEKLNKILNKNEQRYQEKLRKKYKSDNIFKNRIRSKVHQSENELNNGIMEFKETYLNKIFKRCKKLFFKFIRK